MSDIHIQRNHQLGLSAARQVAQAWAEKAERKLDMACTYETGETEDRLHFSRAGVTGTLRVDAQDLELNAELGFLFGAFKERIASEINGQFDQLLGAASAPAAPPPTTA